MTLRDADGAVIPFVFRGRQSLRNGVDSPIETVGTFQYLGAPLIDHDLDADSATACMTWGMLCAASV